MSVVGVQIWKHNPKYINFKTVKSVLKLLQSMLLMAMPKQIHEIIARVSAI